MNPLEFMLYFSIITMCGSALVMAISLGNELIFGASEVVFYSAAAVFIAWLFIASSIIILA